MRELVSLHVTDRERIAARLQEQGQVILALDGLQPDVGHEVLWVVRVKRLLEPFKVPIKGIISDGEETIRSAAAFVFPGVPHQLCQCALPQRCHQALLRSGSTRENGIEEAIARSAPD